jgi:hypothetical protein
VHQYFHTKPPNTIGFKYNARFRYRFEIKGLHAKSLWRLSLTMVFAARTIEGQAKHQKIGAPQRILSGQVPDRAFFVT